MPRGYPKLAKLSDLPMPPARLGGMDVLKLVRAEGEKGLELLRDQITEAYYNTRGSLPTVCRTLGLSYRQLSKLRKDDGELKEALKAVDEIIADEVHQQFLDRVLDPSEKHPAWKIFYLKKNDPKYADRPSREAPIQINLTFQDSTLKPMKTIKAINAD